VQGYALRVFRDAEPERCSSQLGRPGYGATTEGTWPYSYDSCDVGTLPNQTWVNGTGPAAALNTGANNGPLSYLPGQRWSACTCPGEDHPGPKTSKGRGSPEIDIIEAQINIAQGIGEVSQSLQTAPFDDFYQFDNSSRNVEQYYPNEMNFNTYLGGVYQQAVSTLVNTDTKNYRATSGGFGTYGFEYTADPDHREDGYVTWVSSGKPSWSMKAGATGANPRTQISARPIPEEPMTIILNFGMSNNFQFVDFDNLVFVSGCRCRRGSSGLSVVADMGVVPPSAQLYVHRLCPGLPTN
jgi:beta-glucanase (GH16 family)